MSSDYSDKRVSETSDEDASSDEDVECAYCSGRVDADDANTWRCPDDDCEVWFCDPCITKLRRTPHYTGKCLIDEHGALFRVGDYATDRHVDRPLDRSPDQVFASGIVIAMGLVILGIAIRVCWHSYQNPPMSSHRPEPVLFNHLPPYGWEKYDWEKYDSYVDRSLQMYREDGLSNTCINASACDRIFCNTKDIPKLSERDYEMIHHLFHSSTVPRGFDPTWINSNRDRALRFACLTSFAEHKCYCMIPKCTHDDMIKFVRSDAFAQLIAEGKPIPDPVGPRPFPENADLLKGIVKYTDPVCQKLLAAPIGLLHR